MEKQKKKKLKLVDILPILIGAIIGYTIGFDSVKLFPKEFIKSLNLVAVLIIFITIYYSSILLHELGHFCAFKAMGVNIRMIKVSIVGVIFNKNKTSLKINPSGLGVGGIVVPHIGIISDEAKFKEMQKIYAKAMIAAPMVTLSLVILGGISIVISSVMGIMNTPYLMITGIFLCLFNILLCIGCFIKTENVYGDFRAYSCFKKDNFFAALMMYQYIMLAEDFVEERAGNTYLRQVLIEGFKNRAAEKEVDMLTISCSATFLIEYLVGEMEKLPESIAEYIDYCYLNQTLLTNQKALEIHKSFLVYMAYYFEKTGEHSKAEQIYEEFITKLPKNQVFDYWKMQAEQIILKKDHTQHLLDVKNIKPNSFYKILGVFNGFYWDELILNQMDKDELMV